jgi:hypothetical protein
MNGITGMIDLLMAAPLSEEQQDCAPGRASATSSCRSSTTSLRFESRSGTLAAMVDFIHRAMHASSGDEGRGAGREADVGLVFDPSPPCSAAISKLQVVTNLVENAVVTGTPVVLVFLQTEPRRIRRPLRSA